MVRLVWNGNPDDTKNYWESDWIRFLVGEVEEVINSNYTQFGPDSILVTSSLSPEFLDYCRGFTLQGYRFGVILLSDEWGKYCQNSDYPEGASFIFRNYLLKDGNNQNISQIKGELAQKIYYFPLGIKQKFWIGQGDEIKSKLPISPNCANDWTVSVRKFKWSFIGALKGNREVILNRLMPHKPFFYKKISYWNSNDSLTTADYRNVLLSTQFVPSMKGNYSFDCFRTYEALEAGSIPITNVAYYRELAKICGFNEEPPFVDFGDNLDEIFNRSEEEIESLRRVCFWWWTSFKIQTKGRFGKVISRAF